MKNLTAIAGFAILLLAAVGRLCGFYHGDPLSDALRANGSYPVAMGVILLVLVIAVMWLIREMRALYRLKNRRD